MTAAASLAAELARPVVRGLLSIEEAEAALAVRLAAVDRLGLGEGYGTVDELFDIDCDVLRQHIRKLDLLRLDTTALIERAAIPLIAARPLLPPGWIRAEAHDINAEQPRDAQLTEHQVEELLQVLLCERRLVEEQQAAERRQQGLLLTSKPAPYRRRFHGRG